MDIGRAFTFIREDEEWVTKILLGGLILLIPIVGWLAIVGYMLEVARNVSQGSPRPLPSWNKFGDLLTQGFYGFVIALVYQIPVIILSVLTSCLTAVSTASNDNGAAVGIVLLFVLLLNLLQFVVGLVMQLGVFGGYVRYIQTNSLSAALQFRDVITMIRASLKTWLMLLLMYILCGIVGSLGIIACGIGVLFTAVYGQAAFGYFLGQVVAQMGGTSRYVPPVDPGSGFGSPTYQ